MAKKAITCILIFLFIFNITMQNRVMAETIKAEGFSESDFNQLNNGTVTRESTSGTDIKYKTKAISDSKNENNQTFGLIGSILTFVFLPLPLLTQGLLTLAIMPTDVTKIQLFTIEDMLFGRFELFNVDFMGEDGYSAKNDEAYVPSDTNELIKKNVAGWFYALRNFTIVALFAVLIAIGILMAISSIASERAKYKSMLIHWVASFVIVMILPYIMAVAFTISNGCVSVIRNVAENLSSEIFVASDQIEQTKGLNFEKTLVFGRANTDGKGFDGILTKISKSNGWEAFSLMIVYVVIAFYQLKFFFMYLKRMIAVGLLMVVSPLITITYSIDKAGDNQAQIFKAWIKEFLINVFVQPLHALLFVIFMYSVYGIMERAPILAIIFIAALSRGEQLFRTIFKVDRTTSLAHLGRKGKGK